MNNNSDKDIRYRVKERAVLLPHNIINQSIIGDNPISLEGHNQKS